MAAEYFEKHVLNPIFLSKFRVHVEVLVKRDCLITLIDKSPQNCSYHPNPYTDRHDLDSPSSLRFVFTREKANSSRIISPPQGRVVHDTKRKASTVASLPSAFILQPMLNKIRLELAPLQGGCAIFVCAPHQNKARYS